MAFRNFGTLRPIITGLSIEPTTTATARDLNAMISQVHAVEDPVQLSAFIAQFRNTVIPYTNAAAFIHAELERMQHLLEQPGIPIYQVKGIFIRSLTNAIPSAPVFSPQPAPTGPAFGRSASRFSFSNTNMNGNVAATATANNRTRRNGNNRRNGRNGRNVGSKRRRSNNNNANNANNANRYGIMNYEPGSEPQAQKKRRMNEEPVEPTSALNLSID
jgi:hypothetical protein